MTTHNSFQAWTISESSLRVSSSSVLCSIVVSCHSLRNVNKQVITIISRYIKSCPKFLPAPIPSTAVSVTCGFVFAWCDFLPLNLAHHTSGPQILSACSCSLCLTLQYWIIYSRCNLQPCATYTHIPPAKLECSWMGCASLWNIFWSMMDNDDQWWTYMPEPLEKLMTIMLGLAWLSLASATWAGSCFHTSPSPWSLAACFPGLLCACSSHGSAKTGSAATSDYLNLSQMCSQLPQLCFGVAIPAHRGWGMRILN